MESVAIVRGGTDKDGIANCSWRRKDALTYDADTPIIDVDTGPVHLGLGQRFHSTIPEERHPIGPIGAILLCLMQVLLHIEDKDREDTELLIALPLGDGDFILNAIYGLTSKCGLTPVYQDYIKQLRDKFSEFKSVQFEIVPTDMLFADLGGTWEERYDGKNKQ